LPSALTSAAGDLSAIFAQEKCRPGLLPAGTQATDYIE
jgi:hypothetical protein